MIRSLSGILFVYLLAMMLAGTSPTGAGQGVHQGQLLDLLIPHVHVVDGKVVTAGAQPASTSTQAGPALGAGAGAAATAAVGAMSTPPNVSMVMPATGQPRPLSAAERALPQGRIEAPPDPPPLPRS